MRFLTLSLTVVVLSVALPAFAGEPNAEVSPWKKNLKPLESFFVHQPDTKTNLPEVLHESDTPYEVHIVREAGNKTEAHLLRIAEAVCAGTDIMQKERVRRRRDAAAQPDEAPQWWIGTFDAIRTAAYTSPRAIEYYQGIAREFQQGNWAVSNNIPMKNSKLEYEASITKYDEIACGDTVHRDVYVAHLNLTWDQYCGPECAMYERAEELVVMKEDGTIEAVYWRPFGDVIVS